MEKKSSFLPESVSGALKALSKRVCGGVMLVIALWAAVALVFFDPNLDGVTAASTFGNQSIMGNIVGGLRFVIGFIPALFFILCVARWGLVWLMNWDTDAAPEYNFLRCFVAVCVGAAGFGMIVPSSSFGGMIGALAATDVSSLIGNWTVMVGVALVLVFAALASVLLHIKWVHIKSALYACWRGVRWVLSVFHLMPMNEYPAEDTDEEDNPIDYSNIVEVGEHTVKIIAKDDYDNATDPIEVKLTILEVEGNMYTVTFNSDGGSEVKRKRVAENGSVIEPTEPTKEGYNFLGWYLNDAEFDFNTKITSDITLIAKWEEISAENPGGGNGGGGTSVGPIISSISLNYKRMYLSPGQTKTVTAYVNPANSSITWTSSNTAVATVSNGNITGVGNGTATITATANGKSASVEVIVSGSGSGSSCSYGNTTYNTSYVLSVNLTQNGCAINPNSTPNETLSTSDYQRLVNELSSMGLRIAGNNFSHQVDRQKIRNTSGTGLVGYQLTISVGIIDSDNPYVVMQARYILRSDGSRQFITNNICKNNVCLS